jgi:diacylglycerol kinase family enzyme
MAGRDIEQALAVASERRIDLGRVTVIGQDGCEVVRHFINISSFGSSGLIVDKVNKATKALGGRASYLIGTVKGLIQYRNQRVRLRVDDEILEQEVNMVAVANGRFFGGSMMIAPGAILDDGLFDVVIVGDVGLAAFLRYSGRIYRGEHLSLPGIKVLTGKSLEALPLGNASVLVDVDGEQAGRLPARYKVLPRAISALAPWTRAAGVRQSD